MKLGFYDSGLGGISVLKNFVERFGNRYSYVYFGDSANAPYGDKSPEQLVLFLENIFDYMLQAEVDIVISACNTSSMYLHEVDRDLYPFEILSLFDAMKKFFETNKFSEKLALLATQATVNSRRYEAWKADILPLACPLIVPLIEAGKLEEAKSAWLNYLSQLPRDINRVIVGCTHYSFLLDEQQKQKFQFIDPAQIIAAQFADSVYADATILGDKSSNDIDIKFHFTKADQNYGRVAQSLLAQR